MSTTTTPLTEDIVKYISECRQKPHPESYLIPVLQKVQSTMGYLSTESMSEVSRLLQVPSTRVTGVATFYQFFTFEPRGRHTITICMGTACYVRGAGKVLDRLKEMLNLKEGGTTADGKFSLDVARCIGACALAPVLVVDGRVFGNVKMGELSKILDQYH